MPNYFKTTRCPYCNAIILIKQDLQLEVVGKVIDDKNPPKDITTPETLKQARENGL